MYSSKEQPAKEFEILAAARSSEQLKVVEALLIAPLGRRPRRSKCMYVCHRGHYEGLSRCGLAGSCVLPGENLFT